MYRLSICDTKSHKYATILVQILCDLIEKRSKSTDAVIKALYISCKEHPKVKRMQYALNNSNNVVDIKEIDLSDYAYGPIVFQGKLFKEDSQISKMNKKTIDNDMSKFMESHSLGGKQITACVTSNTCSGSTHQEKYDQVVPFRHKLTRNNTSTSISHQNSTVASKAKERTIVQNTLSSSSCGMSLGSSPHYEKSGSSCESSSGMSFGSPRYENDDENALNYLKPTASSR